MSKVIKVKERFIGEGYPVYIIAEMSANHTGDFSKALEIVHAAKEAGADCIKIQTYTADTITINSNKDFFQIKKGLWKGDSLYNLYKKAYTPWEWQARLKEEAEKLGLHFFSSPFDKTAVDFLEELGVDFYKIASFEIIDIPLIEYVASKRKPIIMSTGLATLGEIEEAVDKVKELGNDNLCLLKCSSAYPAIPEDMNLKTIKHLEITFNLPVGLSDHSLGSIGAATAVAMGAKVIEKHLCLSREIESPDSKFSMEPNEFKKMVEDIKVVERAMGKICYKLSEREKINQISRKSIFVVKDIKKGEVFTEGNIRVIRPGHGLKPKYYDKVIGKKALFDIEKGMPLAWNMLE